MSLDEQYEEDHARIGTSGPHTLTDEMRQGNRELREALRRTGLWPLPDAQKRGDCDLLYRFLIARKWQVPECVAGLREYDNWRRSSRADVILSEYFDENLGDLPLFMGRDREGYPIMYNTPDPKVLTGLLHSRPRAELIRRHFMIMERGRYLCNKYKTDRVSCVLDLSKVTMGNITTDAMSFLKEIAHLDQTYYPENMRRMIVCNGGWAVTAAWKIIRPLLDPRVQQKIAFVSGPPRLEVLKDFIDPSQIPATFGGTADEEALREDFSALLAGAASPGGQVGGTTSVSSKAAPPLIADDNKGGPEDGLCAGESLVIQRTATHSEESDEEIFYSLPATDEDEDEGGDGAMVPTPGALVIMHQACADEIAAQTTRLQASHSGYFHTKPASAARSQRPSISTDPPASDTATAAAAIAPSAQAGPSSPLSPVVVVKRVPASPGPRAPSQPASLPTCRADLLAKLRLAPRLPFTLHVERLAKGNGYAAFCDGIEVGRKVDTLVLSGEEVVHTVLRETGHPIHTFAILATVDQQAAFVVKKRRIHDLLEVFDIHGDRTVVTDARLKARCDGEKVHVMTVSPMDGSRSKDRRDWVLWRRIRKGKEFLVWKSGAMVEVSSAMTKDADPEVIISLVLLILGFWHFPF